MTYTEIFQQTVIALLAAKFTAEYEGGVTLWKFNGETVFYFGN